MATYVNDLLKEPKADRFSCRIIYAGGRGGSATDKAMP